MTVALDYEGRGRMTIDITGHVAVAIGGILNPEGVQLAITRSEINVVTPSTGAATLNAGIGAAVNTDASDILSALTINGALTGKWYNGHAQIVAAETEITVLWEAGEYLTFTGSDTTVGFVGKLYVEYVRL